MSKILVKQQPTLEDYGMSMQQPVNPEYQHQQMLNSLLREEYQKPITAPKFLPQTRPIDQEALSEEIGSAIQDYYFSPLYGGSPTDKNIPTTGRELVDDYYDTIGGGPNRNLLNIEQLRNLGYERDAMEAYIRDKVAQSEEGQNILGRYAGDNPTLYHTIREHPLMRIHGRQSTLPEHIPAYHTENWQNPDGSIKEGAVAPITALKKLPIKDLERLMAGSGLLPTNQRADFDNEVFEEGVVRDLLYAIAARADGSTDRFNELKLREPLFMGKPDLSRTGAGYFVSPTSQLDVDAAHAMGADAYGSGYVGIRGLNTKDDFLQMRPAAGQTEKTAEGYVSSRIPAERLVPIRVPIGSIPKSLVNYPKESDWRYSSMTEKEKNTPMSNRDLSFNERQSYGYPSLRRLNIFDVTDFRNEPGYEKDESDKRKDDFYTMTTNLTKPFMSYAGKELDREQMIDREGMPEMYEMMGLTPQEKIELLERDGYLREKLDTKARNLQRNPKRLAQLPTDWGSKQTSLDKLNSADIQWLINKLISTAENNPPYGFGDEPGHRHRVALNEYIDKLKQIRNARDKRENAL